MLRFIAERIREVRPFGWLLCAGVFAGMHVYTVQFIHSSYLETLFGTEATSVLFACAAVLAVLTLLVTSALLARFGNYTVALVSAALDIGAVFTLAFTQDPGWVAVCFALHICLISVLLFSFDVFLERGVHNEGITGNVRGAYLGAITVAVLLGPILGGWIAGEAARYTHVYLVSALFLTPLLLILPLRFRSFIDPPYRMFRPLRIPALLRANMTVFHISMAQFLLRFYFAWSVIYLPLYLHQIIGFSWGEIGIVFFLMLLPYLLIEWPAGVIADTWLGEKEMLIAGFGIIIVSTIGMWYLTTPSLLVWGAVLFLTRAGAALVESMTETHLFKQVDGDDTDTITLFRVLNPLAFVAAPSLALITLAYADMRTLWLVLALVMCLGIYHASRITDTR